jgi:hypothetical protein
VQSISYGAAFLQEKIGFTMTRSEKSILMDCLLIFSVACAGGKLETHPYRVGFLQNETIAEASGLAASRRNFDILWTLNDSGNEPILYALSPTGEDAGRLYIDAQRILFIFLYRRPNGQSWETALADFPKVLELPSLKQAESICFSADGRHLFVTSEKRPAPLLRINPAFF